MANDSCRTCRFWDVYEADSAYYDDVSPRAIGDCRRRAPRISEELLRRSLPGPGMDQFEMLANNLYVPSAFPVTAGESWCGEFERAVHVDVEATICADVDRLHKESGHGCQRASAPS